MYTCIRLRFFLATFLLPLAAHACESQYPSLDHLADLFYRFPSNLTVEGSAMGERPDIRRFMDQGLA